MTAFPIPGDSAFDRLKNSADFRALVDEVHREFPAVHHAKAAFAIPQRDLIPEGLAVDPKKHFFYMGSLSRKKIIKINRAGAVQDFVPSGRYGLQSVCGIKVDPGNGDVWAKSCVDSGAGAELLHFNDRGKLLERFSPSTPNPHLFNDLVLRGADEIYLTDSLANQALRFDRKTHAFSALTFPRPMFYPNGIALSEGGNLLYVADAFGVLQYDLRSGRRAKSSGERRTRSRGSTAYTGIGAGWLESKTAWVHPGLPSSNFPRMDPV
jgi:sugar lactone lactonase YvrE